MPETYAVQLYCPDCRGRFEVEGADVLEGEVLECSLCGAEILVKQENPIKIKLYQESDDF